MEQLDALDRSLLLWLNAKHAVGLDGFMMSATDTKFWIPLYLLFIFLLFRKLDNHAWLALACIGLAILVSDQLTSGLIKPLVQRLRPSHNPDLEGLLHLVKDGAGQFYRGGMYGFPSSHASNSFAIATLLYLLLKNHLRLMGLIFIPAALMTYTRIYLGVHYPFDIFTGIIIGIVTAILCHKLYKRILTSLNHKRSANLEG